MRQGYEADALEAMIYFIFAKNIKSSAYGPLLISITLHHKECLKNVALLDLSDKARWSVPIVTALSMAFLAVIKSGQDGHLCQMIN